MAKRVGVLTAGGDSPGLNAVLRGVGKAAIECYGMEVIGFRDGFRGLMEGRTMLLDEEALSGILTVGGTVLGTSRDKPHRMPVNGRILDKTGAIVKNYRKYGLDVLVCLGGGGTQKNAYRLMHHGLNILTLPKTIDNDIAMTDVSFGFQTALTIATEAIDRLHSTAHSHHRIIVVETMGHNAGWLALGAGIAGGADVILIPEIPYDVRKISQAILARSRVGKPFSIVAIAEGATPKAGTEIIARRPRQPRPAHPASDRTDMGAQQVGHAMRLAEQLEKLTGLESRVTILGYLQRGGTPSPGDRLLATRLGTACANLIKDRVFGAMVAARGDGTEPVPLGDVVGKRKTVPRNHSWIQSARQVGVSFGD
jgi:ATP-dependent phosphofructokinase / diphosphate-dependent phosphofructokinase